MWISIKFGLISVLLWPCYFLAVYIKKLVCFCLFHKRCRLHFQLGSSWSMTSLFNSPWHFPFHLYSCCTCPRFYSRTPLLLWSMVFWCSNVFVPSGVVQPWRRGILALQDQELLGQRSVRDSQGIFHEDQVLMSFVSTVYPLDSAVHGCFEHLTQSNWLKMI